MKERNTKQKAMILSAVRGTYTHPTAEQVHALVAPQMPSVSLGTVYRNLNRLAELGEIRRISVTNSPDRFDGDLTPHHHVCCLGCGCFMDEHDLPYNASLDKNLAKKSGFRITRHETVFYGYCPNCREN